MIGEVVLILAWQVYLMVAVDVRQQDGGLRSHKCFLLQPSFFGLITRNVLETEMTINFHVNLSIYNLEITALVLIVPIGSSSQFL